MDLADAIATIVIDGYDRARELLSDPGDMARSIAEHPILFWCSVAACALMVAVIFLIIFRRPKKERIPRYRFPPATLPVEEVPVPLGPEDRGRHAYQDVGVCGRCGIAGGHDR